MQACLVICRSIALPATKYCPLGDDARPIQNAWPRGKDVSAQRRTAEMSSRAMLHGPSRQLHDLRDSWLCLHLQTQRQAGSFAHGCREHDNLLVDGCLPHRRNTTPLQRPPQQLPRHALQHRGHSICPELHHAVAEPPCSKSTWSQVQDWSSEGRQAVLKMQLEMQQQVRVQA